MNTKPSLGDRYAEWTVIVVTVAALLAGWFVMSGMVNRTIPFESDGVSAASPAGWKESKPAEGELLNVHELGSTGYETTYIISKLPVPQDGGAGTIASLLTLERATALTGYRVLGQREVTMNGREALEVSYVYIESNPDLTHAEIPAVVRGLDYIFVSDGNAVIATYHADQSDYEGGLDRFYRFVESIRF